MEMSCRLRKDFICDESISDGFLRRCREWGTVYRIQHRDKAGGDYEAEFYMQPSNPVTTENRLQYAVSVNDVPMQILDAVTDDFKIGDHQPVWARGVLDQIRRRSVPVQLEQGINTIRVTPVTPGFVLEKIVIYPHGNKPAEAYLGPTETYRCRS